MLKKIPDMTYSVYLLAALLCSISFAQGPIKRQQNSPKLIRQNIRCGAGPSYPAIASFNGARITNGTNAVKNSWPSMVAIATNRIFGCGGSLLDEYHVLTAAHCVVNIVPQNTSALAVLLGMHSLTPVDDAQVVRKIRRVILHPEFNTTTVQNDIAILEMDSPVQFTDSISPICLPKNEDALNKFIEVKATTVGWGFIQEDSSILPSVLQQVTLETTSNEICKTKILSPSSLVDEMLCAQYPRRGVCRGDSGGPLFYQSSQGSQWIQIGIVSFRFPGTQCGDSTSPSVFTRVTSYLNWINNHIFETTKIHII